jgi:hypothetical protein
MEFYMTTLELWNFHSEEDGYITESKTDTQWKYLLKDRVLYFAFQGSVSILDWIFNFIFFPFFKWQKGYKDMKTPWYSHIGFLFKWKAIEDTINNIIQDKLKEFDSIVVTGHSQGGALAILCHEFINFNYKPSIALNTVVFGAPRVVFFINYDKIKERFSDITCYRHYLDIVTRLPFKLFGFKDVGVAKYVGGKNFLKVFKIKDNHLSYAKYLESK